MAVLANASGLAERAVPAEMAVPTHTVPDDTVLGDTVLGDTVLGYALRLRGISIHGHVGVSEVERERIQELLVGIDVEFSGDLYPTRDELAQAADYVDIVRAADDAAKERGFLLLETLALNVARRLRGRFPAATQVRVAITKAVVPVTPRASEATVEVTLGAAA